MSIQDLDAACELIKTKFTKDERFFGGGQSVSLIEEAEKVLGLTFPKSYKMFLQKYGYGGVNSFDIDGITSYKPEGSSYGGVVWSVLERRKKFNYPAYLIPIYDVGEGTAYCLDTSQMNAEGECPVVAWPVGGYEETPVLEIVAEDFGSFFLKQVEEQIKRKKERESSL